MSQDGEVPFVNARLQGYFQQFLQMQAARRELMRLAGASFGVWFPASEMCCIHADRYIPLGQHDLSSHLPGQRSFAQGSTLPACHEERKHLDSTGRLLNVNEEHRSELFEPITYHVEPTPVGLPGPHVAQLRYSEAPGA